jgi:hypothetical protein
MIYKHKKTAIALFATLALILVLENPSISAVNIYYSYTSISSSAPLSDDGFFLQGSSIIAQSTITYVNQSTYQPLYYRTVYSFFNFGSFLLVFFPTIFLWFFNDIKKVKKIG